MAAAKTSKKSTTKSTKTKSTAKTTAKSKSTAGKASKASAKSKSASKASMTKTKAKTTTKASPKKSTTSKATSRKNQVTTFLNDVVKKATKELKTAQSQTKKVIKDLNAQDKQLAVLYKKQSKATAKTRAGLDSKISKLHTQMSSTRSTLLAAEAGADKVATLIEWVQQLSAKPSTTAYLSNTPQTSGKPTLVQTKPSKASKTSKTSKTSSKAQSKFAPPSDDEEFEEELFPDDEGDDELGFAFDDEDEEELNRL